MRWGEFWRPYIGWVVCGEINLMVLIGGVGCYPMREEHVVEERRLRNFERR
jgi:hypothetical protein